MAYVVGSASVEVVPDFRRAQVEITRFFEKQGDKVRVPVDFDVDQQSARRLREQVVSSQREIARSTRQDAVNREQLYSRMFDTIEKREAQAARATERANAERAKSYQKLFDEAEKNQTRAFREELARRNEVAQQSLEVRNRIESRYAERSKELTRRELFDREQLYTSFFDTLDKRQAESDARAARIADLQRQRDELQRQRNAQVDFLRTPASSTGGSSFERELQSIERAQVASARNGANERLRIEESTLTETERMRVRSLRDQEDAERQSLLRIAEERRRSTEEYTRLREQATERIRRADVDLRPFEDEVDLIGQRSGSSLGRTLLNNFRQEIRTRATFFGAVLAAAFIAGAPALLAVGPTLFGGIGLAATANAEEVQDAWKSTWNSILSDTRKGASDFIQVHQNLAARTRETFVSLRPAINTAFSAAAPLTEQFGNALLETGSILLSGLVPALTKAEPVIRGIGELLTKTATGFSTMFTEMAASSPIAGASISEFGDVLEELLPALGKILTAGAEFATAVLPLVTGALGGLNVALSVAAPLLPLVAGGFAAMKLAGAAAAGISFLAARVTGLATGLAQVTYNTTGVTRAVAGSAVGGLDRFSSRMSRVSSAVAGAGSALPLFGAAVALIGLQMQQAAAQEEGWARALLDGGSAAKQAAEDASTSGVKWQTALSFFGVNKSGTDALGITSSFQDAREEADKLLAAMPPLQRAQTLAKQSTNDLAFAIETYGENSAEAVAAASKNEEQQKALAEAQRQANIELRNTVSSADAAKAAMEDYEKAIASGDVDAAAESLQRYREESKQATNDQRLLNIATADTKPSIDAAKDAMEDYTKALAAGNAGAAAESLGRYKRESAEATREQIALEDAIYGTNQLLEDQRDIVLAATDKQFALRQATLDMNEAQGDLQDTLNSGKATTEEIEQANLDFETSILDVATAAGELAAQQLPATATALERTKAQTDGTLAQLILLRDQMGDKFPASLQATITQLQGTTTGLGFSQNAANLFRDAILGIPTSRSTTVTADISQATQQIRDFLGLKWNATVTVNAVKGAFGFDRAYGGPIPGASPNDRADDVPINATSGEFMHQRSAVRKYGTPFMYAVNSGAFPIDLAMTGLSGLSENRYEADANRGYATGGLILPDTPVRYSADLANATSMVQGWVNAAATAAAASGGPAGSGAVGGGWQSIARIVQAAIPQARINSTYRPGDPGYHGKGKAVDFGFGSGPGGAGSQGLASIAKFLYNGYGSTLAELIYDGLYDSTPDVKNGRAHTYNSVTRAEHRNHVHAAVYDWGGALKPGLNLMMNATGATEYLTNSTAAINGFREMLGASGGSLMPRFNASALAGMGGSSNDMRSVTGFVNNGTIVVADVESFGREAENSKRASMAQLGLL